MICHLPERYLKQPFGQLSQHGSQERVHSPIKLYSHYNYMTGKSQYLPEWYCLKTLELCSTGTSSNCFKTAKFSSDLFYSTYERFSCGQQLGVVVGNTGRREAAPLARSGRTAARDGCGKHRRRRQSEIHTDTSFSLFKLRLALAVCLTAVSDQSDIVVHRANYLLENGFGCYNVFKNNCEDFAIYCKTGLLVLDQRAIGQGGQAVSIVGGPLAAVLSTPLRLVTTNVYGIAATAVGVYCMSRYAADIGSGMRRDVVKVSVEDLTRRLAAGLIQVMEPLPAPVS
ncbi:hypothetical protein SAY87_024102 [Trapa incisa]|uniref:LRAT domain-containing protein n=1 Tax=Trapa incisa TaxID=236973 RepID=A0AAN7KZR3_9MYRT|nr:hypothetical protein SAY87_024102 [Trapa incisa]